MRFGGDARAGRIRPPPKSVVRSRGLSAAVRIESHGSRRGLPSDAAGAADWYGTGECRSTDAIKDARFALGETQFESRSSLGCQSSGLYAISQFGSAFLMVAT